MPVTTNFQNWSPGKKQRAEIVQALDTVLKQHPAKWHVQFIGAGEDLEMRVSGPGVEDSELVSPEASAEHIAAEVARIAGL